MSSRWMREIMHCGAKGSTYWGWFRKAFALWLYRVMDFSFQAEYCEVGGKSWISTEKSGTGGAFDGSSFNFTDAAATFVRSDCDKLIVIKDNANPKNGGVYRIAGYNSASSIIIDFRAGTFEYPAVSSGLSWWIFGQTYQMPEGIDDWVRLQSRHATGWAIELRTYYYITSLACFQVRVAPLGDWGGAVLGNELSGETAYDRIGVRSSDNSSYDQQSIFYAEADYDCEWLHFITLNNKSYSSFNPNNNAVQLITVARVQPIESGVPDSDLLVLRGKVISNHNGDRDSGYRGWKEYTEPAICRGFSWCSTANAQIIGGSVDYSYSGFSASFGKNDLEREFNIRRGRINEAFYGEPYAVDPENTYGQYRLLGYLKGEWVMPVKYGGQGAGYTTTDHRSAHTSCRLIHKLCPINMAGDRDKLHVTDGIVIPWCGLSLIGQGAP